MEKKEKQVFERSIPLQWNNEDYYLSVRDTSTGGGIALYKEGIKEALGDATFDHLPTSGIMPNGKYEHKNITKGNLEYGFLPTIPPHQEFQSQPLVEAGIRQYPTWNQEEAKLGKEHFLPRIFLRQIDRWNQDIPIPVGSILVQAVCEISNCLYGTPRVETNSSYHSGGFYYLQHFRSKKADKNYQMAGKIMKKIKDGEKAVIPRGGDMFIPNEGMRMWLEKIQKSPLLDQETTKDLLDFHSRSINWQIESALTGISQEFLDETA